MNKVILSGRLTRDPELKQVGEAEVCNFSLAVDRGVKDAQGNKQADFFNCQAWKGTANLLNTYCKKGSKVLVEGRLQTRTYQGQDGTSHSITEVVTDKLEFLDSISGSKSNQNGAPAETPADASNVDEDLPF